MANRTETIQDIWAADAVTVIPPTPAIGVPYRQTALDPATIRGAWPYKTVIGSAIFNQALFELFTVVNSMEKKGVAQYSELTDYVAGGLCTRDDGATMKAAVANGPASTLRDPNDEASIPTYWTVVSNAGECGVASPPIEEDATVAKTLVTNDIGKVIRMTNAAASVVTIPVESGTFAPAKGKDIIVIRWSGVGQPTITGATGVTLNGIVSPATGGAMSNRYTDVMLHRVSANVWEAIGAIGTVV